MDPLIREHWRTILFETAAVVGFIAAFLSAVAAIGDEGIIGTVWGMLGWQ